MKAMLIDDNKNLVWSEVPYPAMGEEEAIVKIHAAALNRADLLQPQGHRVLSPLPREGPDCAPPEAGW